MIGIFFFKFSDMEKTRTIAAETSDFITLGIQQVY